MENVVGSVEVPLGKAGPLLIGKRKHFVFLATTERVLVASVNRGCKAITLSGGAETVVEKVGVNRGPVFRVEGIVEGQRLRRWIDKHFGQLKRVSESTSEHLKLLGITTRMSGRSVWAKFDFDSGEAMGMNMVTRAVAEAVKLIEKKTKVSLVALAGNFEIDKKPAFLSFHEGRGRRVWAQTRVPRRVVKEVLKTEVKKIVEINYRKNLLGAAMSGSLGFSAQTANVIAAIYLATGQDVAHVVEGSLAMTTAEELENGDLYLAVYLPAVLVGTVGGGTNLETQRSALAMMKVRSAVELAKVIGAAVLAGELSLLASLAEGSLAVAHRKVA